MSNGNGQAYRGDVRLLFPKEYIASEDITHWEKKRKRPVVLTISKLAMEGLRTDSGEEQKPVLSFKEFEEQSRRDRSAPNKRLVLNKTNAKAIAAALGSHEVSDWMGKRIELFATTCQAFGKTVDCVRVKDRAPQDRQQKRQEPPPESFDEAPESDWDASSGEAHPDHQPSDGDFR